MPRPARVTPGARTAATAATSAPIVGGASDYPVIAVDEDGSERAVATIGVQLVDDESNYINVHQSPQQMGTIVACGPLED